MNLRSWIITVLLGVVNYNLISQSIRLSHEAEILALTCGPDNRELYSAFGHSAFRVADPILGIDWIYNYGTFDFNQPNFYLNFARGNLLYMLSKQEYERFKNVYIYFNRSIYEQVLNLNPSQKQRLFDFLEQNALPENKFYHYDYFYDNCATKLRDVLEEVFPGTIRWDPSYTQEEVTIREMVDRYTLLQPWGDLGIDLCLGLPMDKVMEPYEFMFIPDYIFKAFEHATLKTDSVEIPLVKRSITTYESVPTAPKVTLFSPNMIFWVAFILVLIMSVIEFRKKTWFKAFDIILFLLLGLLGVFFLWLWFGTDHKSAYNFNLLWALPTHLLGALILIPNSKIRLLKTYFLITMIIQGLVIATWSLLPQGLHPSLLPLVIIFLMRSWIVYRNERSIINSTRE